MKVVVFMINFIFISGMCLMCVNTIILSNKKLSTSEKEGWGTYSELLKLCRISKFKIINQKLGVFNMMILCLQVEKFFVQLLKM